MPKQIKIDVPEGMEMWNKFVEPHRIEITFRPAYMPIEVKGVPLDEAPWAKDGQDLLMWDEGCTSPITVQWENGRFMIRWDGETYQVESSTRVARLRLV